MAKAERIAAAREVTLSRVIEETPASLEQDYDDPQLKPAQLLVQQLTGVIKLGDGKEYGDHGDREALNARYTREDDEAKWAYLSEKYG